MPDLRGSCQRKSALHLAILGGRHQTSQDHTTRARIDPLLQTPYIQTQGEATPWDLKGRKRTMRGELNFTRQTILPRRRELLLQDTP